MPSGDSEGTYKLNHGGRSGSGRGVVVEERI